MNRFLLNMNHEILKGCETSQVINEHENHFKRKRNVLIKQCKACKKYNKNSQKIVMKCSFLFFSIVTR